jgi:hypothetical protein
VQLLIQASTFGQGTAHLYLADPQNYNPSYNTSFMLKSINKNTIVTCDECRMFGATGDLKYLYVVGAESRHGMV